MHPSLCARTTRSLRVYPVKIPPGPGRPACRSKRAPLGGRRQAESASAFGDGKSIAFPFIQCDLQPPHEGRKCDAGTTDAGARSKGASCRQGSIHPGGRVRSRGDRARAGGQAWRSIGQAGHRDRPVEGATRGRQAETARQGHHQRNKAPCGARCGQERPPPSAPSPRRSRATLRALKREPRKTVSREALAKQARASARRRSRGRKAGAVSPDAAELDP